jgi:hypothetical protein
MKSRKEIEYAAANLANPNACKTTNWIEGYLQCQEDVLGLLRSEILSAFIHGQGNARGMEAGLERDETEDYVNSRMLSLTKQD